MALPEVTEGLTHGGETWLIRRRSFAKFVHPVKHRLDEEHVALWAAAPAGARQELIAEDPRRFFAPRFGGYDWIGLRLNVRADGRSTSVPRAETELVQALPRAFPAPPQFRRCFGAKDSRH